MSEPRPAGEDPLLIGLNEVQRQAVIHRGRPLLLLAGAGSGKTRVVTHRIARLIRDGVSPRRILALTFTNKAAKEMNERVAALLGEAEVPGLVLSTFHALGARLLRRYGTYFGRSRDFAIYDMDDQLRLLRDVAKRLNLVFTAPQLKVVRRAVDEARNRAEDARQMAQPDTGPFFDTEALGAAYEQALERANAFDFGDLILRPFQLLDQVPEVRADLQQRWPYVLVDEFQDTNGAQYSLLKHLAPPGSDLFVVGDDDQSIYGWRGAEVGNILEFSTAYPSAEVVRLEQNYRSVGRILAAANGVIAHNTNRLGKQLWTAQEEGPTIELHTARDARSEARWVAARIAAMCREADHDPGEVGVLFRANHLTLDLEDALHLMGVPYVVVKGRSFYDRAEVRDAVAYLRLLVNVDDHVAFMRASNVPARGVGKTSLDRLAAFADAENLSIQRALPAALEAKVIKGRARTGLARFQEALTAGAELPAAERLQAVLTEAGLIGELTAEASLDDKAQGRLENVDRLITAVAEFTRRNPEAGLAGFLEQIKLISEVDVANLGQGRVSLLTVHAAKGLEFPTVFVMGMEEGVFPHARSLAERDVEEERRLCYVAITRAQKRLFLTRARMRSTFRDTRANPPSRFLSELPPEVLNEPAPVARAPIRRPARRPAVRPGARPYDAFNQGAGASIDEHCSDVSFSDDFSQGEHWQPGQRVYHAQFGVGVIRAVGAGARRVLTVEFSGIGRKKIAAAFISPYQG